MSINMPSTIKVDPNLIDWDNDGDFAQFVLEALGAPGSVFTIEEEQSLFNALKERRKQMKKEGLL